MIPQHSQMTARKGRWFFLFGLLVAASIAMSVVDLSWVQSVFSQHAIDVHFNFTEPGEPREPDRKENMSKYDAEFSEPIASDITGVQERSDRVVRGVDISLEEFSGSAMQLWSVITGPHGSEFHLASNPEFCISTFGAYNTETLHLWHCKYSANKFLRFNDKFQTLSPTNATEKCVTFRDGILVLDICGIDSCNFSFPANAKLQSSPITTGSASSSGKKLVLTARTSFLSTSAQLGVVCPFKTCTSHNFFQFIARVPSSNLYTALNGTVLLNSHKDGVVIRVCGKRLPADGIYDAVVSPATCAQVFAQPVDGNYSSSSSLVLSMHTAGFGTGSGTFIAGTGYLRLTAPVRSVLLRSGNNIIACASLLKVSTNMIGHETRVYEMSMKFITRASPGNANCWNELGGEQERIFQMIKEDSLKWLPETVDALKIASQKKIAFALVCKNVANVMDQTLVTIEETGKLFKDYRVIIIESNSNDGTDKKVLAWANRNSKVFALSENVQESGREQNIADARNKYMKIYNRAEYDDYEFLGVADCDFEFGWPAESMTSCLLRDDWGGCCGNGFAGVAPHWYYWDRYAFRDDRWPKGPHEVGWGAAEDMLRNGKMLYDPGEDWVPVSGACFGGLTVYRREAIKNCTYTGHDENNKPDCEHLMFSHCVLRNKYKIFMNPSAWLRYNQNMYWP